MIYIDIISADSALEGDTRMGIISILLGIITIIAFVGAGAVVGNAYLGFMAKMGTSFIAMQSGMSNTQVMAAFIGGFGFFGLIIGMNLIMLGLNYNKLDKIQKRVRRL